MSETGGEDTTVITRVQAKKDKDQIRKMKWVLFSIFVAIFVILVICTILVVFFGLGKLTDPKKIDILFNVFMVEIGLAVLALFSLLFKLKPKQQGEEKVPEVPVGKYKYELTFPESNTKFLGECVVKQKGRKVTFSGERKHTVVNDKKEKSSVFWSSNWAEMCSDNKIRMDYSIKTAKRPNGYCILQVGSKDSDHLFGEVHIFNPSYVFGTVEYKKIKS